LTRIRTRIASDTCATALPELCCLRHNSAACSATPTQSEQGDKTVQNEKVFAMSFVKVYTALINKAERKNRSKTEADEVIFWLTGYDAKSLQAQLDMDVDLQTFWENAPHINENATLIKGVICGVRVEEITDPLMQKIRWLDKLIDELAKGKPMEKILRSEKQSTAA